MQQDPGHYGDRHASVYDQIYGARFTSEPAVAALAAAAAGGSVLELGMGTGRLAIPLARRGLTVAGIEGSGPMIGQMRAPAGRAPARCVSTGPGRVHATEEGLPGGGVRGEHPVHVAHRGRAEPVHHRHRRSPATRRLLFIEAFRPDPTRFDATGHRTEQRSTADGTRHEVNSRHDPRQQAIHITHLLTIDGVAEAFEVTLTYATPAQLDAMAATAGMRLIDRWHDWNSAPVNPGSTDPISIYRHS